jgi:hypothetical protein
VRKQQLSPWASVLTALSLALGILVADVANVCRLRAAGAQSNSARRFIPVSRATVVGRRIQAVDVLVNGVATRAAFLGRVRIVDSVIYTNGVLTGDNNTVTGVLTGDNNTVNGVLTGDSNSATGVLTGDSNSVTGVLTGDGVAANGVLTGDGSPTVSGGTVEGDNVRVVDGVITGDNLRLVGTTAAGGLFFVQ